MIRIGTGRNGQTTRNENHTGAPDRRARLRRGAVTVAALFAATASVAIHDPVARAAPVPSTQPASRPTTQLSLSFKDVPIDAVLEYLSEAAGFVVVKEAPVDGRVTVISRRPVNADEAVIMLNAVLKTNGYT